MKLASCLSLLLCSSILPTAHAGSPVPLIPATPCRGPFEQRSSEVDLTGGYLYSPVFATGGRAELHYAQSDLSLGWMLTSPRPGFGQDWLRGNWELMGNLFAADVVKGSSGFLAGGRLQFRYNFVQPGSRWVPFVQVGGGGLGNTVYRHEDQRMVGSSFEFTLVADAGVRYFFTPSVAAIVMADFEHISNANTASRNLGINAAGGMVGVGWFF